MKEDYLTVEEVEGGDVQLTFDLAKGNPEMFSDVRQEVREGIFSTLHFEGAEDAVQKSFKAKPEELATMIFFLSLAYRARPVSMSFQPDADTTISVAFNHSDASELESIVAETIDISVDAVAEELDDMPDVIKKVAASLFVPRYLPGPMAAEKLQEHSSSIEMMTFSNLIARASGMPLSELVYESSAQAMNVEGGEFPDQRFNVVYKFEV